ncbi:MAG: Gfo/Idh/MocA family oxidoreductase [Pseudomonadota bacterium]
MTKETIRYGIIGAGMMGREHIRNIKLLPGCEIAALSDPNAAVRGDAFMTAGNRPAQFTDHRELLASGTCDAVVIASPNHTHVDVMRDVLATDLPVLVEKPICTTRDDCTEILQLAAKRESAVWVAMEYRYMPPVQRLLKELAAGTAGELKMMAIREHRFPFLKKVDDWNRFNVNTGGTMVEKCCHFFDLYRLLSGSEPTRVYCSGSMDVNFRDENYDGAKPDIIDNGFVIIDFANGTRAMLDLCMFAEGAYWQETISATGDLARLDAFIPGPARFSPHGQERFAEFAVSPRASKIERREVVHVDEKVLAAGDHHGSTFYQHEKFAVVVRKRGKHAPSDVEVTLEDGMKAVVIGLAAEESARTGMPVDLTSDPLFS